MAVSKRLRYEVLKRDGHRCRYCGRGADEARLTVDHVVPTTLGGSDKPDNLVAACADCNSGKSATPPDAQLVADVAQDQVRWSLAMNTVVERRATELRAGRERLARFDRTWSGYRNGAGQEMPRDANWKNSISRFMGFGLDDEFLDDAIATAMGSPKPSHNEVWKYFCGICWREIEDLQTVAKKTLDAATERPAYLADDEEVESAEMPLMEMFGTFLDAVLAQVPAADEVRKIATKALWNSMPEADQVYTGRSLEWGVPKEGERLDEAQTALSCMVVWDAKLIGDAIRGAQD